MEASVATPFLSMIVGNWAVHAAHAGIGGVWARGGGCFRKDTQGETTVPGGVGGSVVAVEVVEESESGGN